MRECADPCFRGQHAHLRHFDREHFATYVTLALAYNLLLMFCSTCVSDSYCFCASMQQRHRAKIKEYLGKEQLI